MPALQFAVSISDNEHVPLAKSKNRASGYKHNTKVIPAYKYYFCAGLPNPDVVSKYFPSIVCRILMIKHLISYVVTQNWARYDKIT